jgi:hypothetical protein
VLPITDPADSCSGGRAGGAVGLVCCVAIVDATTPGTPAGDATVSADSAVSSPGADAGPDSTAPGDSGGTSDATVTSDVGTGVDAPSATEAAVDTGSDSPATGDDSGVDAPPDGSTEASVDAGADTGADAAGDVAVEAASTCGAAKACATPSDCPATGSACVTATCTTGCCGTVDVAAGTACDDGNACTQTDACQAGACVGSNSVTCTALDQCHVAGTCAPATGICSNPPVVDGTTCNDGNACYSNETCTAGVCGGTFCASALCGTSLAAFAGAKTTGWSFNGSASYDTTSNTAVLTDGVTVAEAGTVIYQDAIAADTFTVAFDFRFTTTNGRADGLAFVLATDGPTALGSGYGGFGVLGLHGYATELDIFDSGPCDPGNGNHAGIDSLSACGTNSGVPATIATSGDLYAQGAGLDHGVGDIGDGVWRTATVSMANGSLSVSITDPATSAAVAVPNLQAVALPGFVPGTAYYFGFGGGSGSNGLASRSEIRNVLVTFGSKRCL